MGERQLFGDTKNIEVEPEFYLGGIPQAMREGDVVQKNLGRISTKLAFDFQIPSLHFFAVDGLTFLPPICILNFVELVLRAR